MKGAIVPTRHVSLWGGSSCLAIARKLWWQVLWRLAEGARSAEGLLRGHDGHAMVSQPGPAQFAVACLAVETLESQTASQRLRRNGHRQSDRVGEPWRNGRVQIWRA